MQRQLCLLTFIAVCGCGSGWSPNSRPEQRSSWKLSLDPASPLDHAQPVLGFILTSDTDEPPPLDPIIVEGEVSGVSVNRYLDGDTTETVLERIRPSVVSTESRRVTLRPTHLLARGARYTLLSRQGVLGNVTVAPIAELPYLQRVWPPRDSSEPALQTLFCGLSAPLEPGPLALFPAESPGALAPGLDLSGAASSHCVRIVAASAAADEVQPPPVISGYLVEPTPWRVSVDATPIARASCTSSETEFGPGCLQFETDRAVIRGPSATTLWLLNSALGWHSESVEGGGKFTLALGDELSETALEVWVFDLLGRGSHASTTVPRRSAAQRVVISEVMANPLGAEPSEEWVELTNAGRAAADMSGWSFGDESVDVALPSVVLEPMAILLLVRSDFVGGTAGDVPPAKGTALIRLPRLGNGLANSGERLVLKDAKGDIVSTFPARAAERAGVSIARVQLLGADDVSSDFAPHASPGASPGSLNRVDD
jgi:hypothetical protein